MYILNETGTVCAMCYLPVALQLTLVKPLCHCRLTARFHHHSPADVRRHVNASLNTQSPFRQNSKLVIKTTDNTLDITLVYFLKAYNCSHLHLKTTGVMFQEFLGFNQKSWTVQEQLRQRLSKCIRSTIHPKVTPQSTDTKVRLQHVWKISLTQISAVQNNR